MNAGDHIQAAMTLAMADGSNPDIHEKWIEVMHRFGDRFGVTCITTMTSDSRTDLLLRALELEKVSSKHPVSLNKLFLLDFQVMLSEVWILRSYEVLRTACQRNKKEAKPCEKLKALRDQFALVRMPIAKYEIAGADRTPVIAELGPMPPRPDDVPRPYLNDGSYIIPRGLNPDTGSVQWCAYDLENETQDWISRKELSDKLLTIFDQ